MIPGYTWSENLINSQKLSFLTVSKDSNVCKDPNMKSDLKCKAVWRDKWRYTEPRDQSCRKCNSCPRRFLIVAKVTFHSAKTDIQLNN